MGLEVGQNSLDAPVDGECLLIMMQVRLYGFVARRINGPRYPRCSDPLRQAKISRSRSVRVVNRAVLCS
jgi:hypothetical protein